MAPEEGQGLARIYALLANTGENDSWVVTSGVGSRRVCKFCLADIGKDSALI